MCACDGQSRSELIGPVPTTTGNPRASRARVSIPWWKSRAARGREGRARAYASRGGSGYALQRMHPFWVAAALGLVGSPPPIQWEAPSQCPSSQVARAQLLDLLGDDPGDVRVDVRISGNEGAWIAEVSLIDHATGFATRRTLRHGDCVTLTEAAVLVVAVGIDPIDVADRMAVAAPQAQAHSPEPGPSLIPAAPELPDTDPLDEVPPTDEETERRRSPPASRPRAPVPPRLDHAIGVAAGVVHGPVPAISGLISVRYSLGREWWQVDAGLSYATPRSQRYEDGQGGGFQSIAFDVRACVTPHTGRLRVPLCAGPTGGMLIARGIDVPNPRRPLHGFAQLGVGGGVQVAVHGRVAITVHGEALVGLARPAFHVLDREALFVAPAFGGRGLVGVRIGL